ncbi:beta-lactamase domain protein [Caldicellulosiruptor saccharolyticus DSM 8903]|uniref:Beta-lactamase domain protein n=1 Tax=Caldicellulosiruptor saccharolyticus (strain ATCC 43494 / DSM 8903 / Tp8T 6331) TaxID=351627 RepID=A4XKF0_CALS8|nr:ComEC/Rec2 family competence protein [Caldicellulosiruptor saccharolyticus]ABP67385.1 beta-lactamase domain protein [Caldicellulosiruptor saccharolyticus DSM 8903]
MKKRALLVLLLIFILLFSAYYSLINTQESFWQNNLKEFLAKDVCTLFFLDVGQGDSILIKSPENRFILVDSGPNTAEERILKIFNILNIKTFDMIIATHPHEDHIGNMDKVISNFGVKKFYTIDKTTNTQTFEDMLKALKEKGLKINIVRPYDRISINGILLTFLSPLKDYEDLNDSSVVTMVEFAKRRVLLTGDISKVVEYDMIRANEDVRADVLKVSHHGSYAATSNIFLKQVNPQLAVISVGKDNPYGHPHDSTLERLKNYRIKVLTTMDNGNIAVIISPDGSVKVLTER